MNKTRILALAAVLTAGVSAPALAAWDKITTINVDYQTDRDNKSPNFGGPVERLQFTARDSDIKCNFIRATFRNGRTVDLFSGNLPEGTPRNVDLPGASQDIQGISTKCHADRRNGGRIEVSADIGRYRDTWRNSPDWSRMWAKMFNWSNSTLDNVVNYWVPITTLHFRGRGDTDGSAAGGAGRSINSIGLKPLNSDAACGKIQATFASGRWVTVANRVSLRQGNTTRLDLPGGDRNLRTLKLSCHAVGRSTVDIQVYGNK